MFADPIIEESATDSLHLENKNLFSSEPDMVITVGFKPGVTDNPGKAALDGFRTIFPEAGELARVSTYLTYVFNEVPKEVEVEWFNEQGEKIIKKMTGLMSICIQHEIDHLDGILFIDYLSKLKRKMAIEKLKKIKKKINK